MMLTKKALERVALALELQIVALGLRRAAAKEASVVVFRKAEEKGGDRDLALLTDLVLQLSVQAFPLQAKEMPHLAISGRQVNAIVETSATSFVPKYA